MQTQTRPETDEVGQNKPVQFDSSVDTSVGDTGHERPIHQVLIEEIDGFQPLDTEKIKLAQKLIIAGEIPSHDANELLMAWERMIRRTTFSDDGRVYKKIARLNDSSAPSAAEYQN